MENYISSLLTQVVADEGEKFHRFRSWKHCYDFFTKELNENNKEEAALHLAFYLASWGMYRGSTFLLQNDYKIHEGVVDILHEHKSANMNDFEQISHIAKQIGAHYENRAHPNAKGNAYASNTLLTKILLGTYGCVPAYDRYFITGMKAQGLSHTFSKKSFEALNEFYKQNQSAFESSVTARFPKMKLLDMYFWKLGFEIEKIKKADPKISTEAIEEKMQILCREMDVTK